MIRAIIILVISVMSAWAELPQDFVRAIHLQESGGQVGAIKGNNDNGRALGPLQIHRSYWKDATDFDKSIGGSYQNCTNLTYATKVMTAYMNRYARQAVNSGNYEVMARVHNGGPTGHKRASTLKYWRDVQKHLANNK